ncbi:MAG: 3-dehydroquinate synthase [Xanthomonadales bacterium]|nr:3-dehydroquinate synthase [Xanthomonadales bacterium]ODU92388.1 MAG: 3-dehydroquinate synthase [Rhodanobacter sp. SCN 66-43]OJY85929.1 MAG: 3-dehydroquinate synthase [Xanthomonadales bacterium 66-474]
MTTVIEVGLPARRYPIRIGTGLLDAAATWRDAIRGGHALIVSDSHVAPLYAQRLRDALARASGTPIHCEAVTLPAGEAHKDLDTASKVLDALAQLGATRDACVLALGGGMVGDIAGFAAACWMRGIDFVQFPTTLLAMVDSSVGGKTGVDHPSGKNLIGAFHQPRAVFADLDTLATLPGRELRAGLAEVVKTACIGDAGFFAWLEAHADALLARDVDALTHAIATCCRFKAGVVVRDEREAGERALLNFGHTFGHAIETETGYDTLLHGEAVAIGMLLAARLSIRLGMADEADAQRLQVLLERFGLPTTVPRGVDAGALFARMRLDKKNRADMLRLILWRGIGRAEIVDDVDPAAVRAVMQG